MTKLPREVLHHFFLELGLPRDTPYTVIRQGTNVVLSIDRFGIVVRASPGLRSDAIKQIELAKNLAYCAPVLQPMQYSVSSYGEWHFTSWPLGNTVRIHEYGRQFGDALRALHRCQTSVSLSRLQPLKSVYKNLDKAKELDVPRKYTDYLEEKCVYLERDCRQMVHSGNYFLHGDAHIGNAVLLNEKLYLIDLDDACIGPWQFDFIPALVAQMRMVDSAYAVRIFDSIKEELTGWEWLDVAIRVREIAMISWLSSLWNTSDKAKEELRLRISSLENPKSNYKWRVF